MWTVVQLTLSRNSLGQAEALLQLSGAAAISLTDASDTLLLEPAPGETPVWPEVRVAALFENPVDTARLGKALSLALAAPVALQHRTLEESDWQDAWRQHWQPLRFGTRLAVVAADDAPPHPQDIVVRLTPGLAFGTGQHPTTALCLEWLADQNLAGKTVADYGTGSGILAIAALKLGARHAYALDIDPQALTACDENARGNNVRDSLTIGTTVELADVTADVMIANILAGPLKTVANQLTRQVARPGQLVLSGLLAHQATAVMDAYRPCFQFERPAERDGWVRLFGQTANP